MKRTKLNAAIALLSIALAACGGGGGGGDPVATTTTMAPPPETAEGLWVGSTNTGQGVTGLVLDDGTYYMLYSKAADLSTIAGVVQGHGESNNGNFTSPDARDFNIEGQGVSAATVSASYAARQWLNGTIMYMNGGSATFTSNYDSQYESTPSLSSLAGTYNGQVASSGGTTNATVTITSGGTITALDATGCNLTGTASPRSRGNVFNISLTFGASCYYTGQTITGIANYDSDPTDKRLYAAAPNASRTDGILFVGVKP